jgi:3-oxoadipate CoA-transferase beta subunit
VVQACTYPLTGIACVKRIYTDMASFECTADGLVLIDMVDGLTRGELESLLKFKLL